MARYLDEESAVADGFVFTHDTQGSRFTLSRADKLLGANQVLGEAHYTLRSDGSIDFDHTIVDPELRGTGLSGVLAHHALTDDIVTDRTIHASCWFIEGYLEKHPELRNTAG